MAQKVLMGSRNLEVMAEVTWSYCICLCERKLEVLSWAGFDVIILSYAWALLHPLLSRSAGFSASFIVGQVCGVGSC